MRNAVTIFASVIATLIVMNIYNAVNLSMMADTIAACENAGGHLVRVERFPRSPVVCISTDAMIAFQ